MKIRLCLLILFLSAGFVKAQWTSSGPSGNNINCSIRIGSDIYIGTKAGLYRSADGGYTYSIVSIKSPGRSVISLFFDSAALYAGFEGMNGVYVSKDTGKTWESSWKGMGTNFNLNDKAFLKINRKVFCVNSTGTYYTTNNGAYWAQLLLPAGLDQYTLPLFSVGNVLFRQKISSFDHILYRSDDEGFNWIQVENGLDHKEMVKMFDIHDTVYAFTKELIYTSVDGGINWKNMTYLPFKLTGGGSFFCSKVIYNGERFFGILNESYPLLCTIAPGDTQWVESLGAHTGAYGTVFFSYGKQIFLGGSEKLYYSENNGDVWSLVENSGISTLGISSVLALGKHIVALGTSGGVYLSDHNGTSWKKDPDFNFTCLGKINSTVIAGTYSGIYRSDDYGYNWNPTSLDKGAIMALTSDGMNCYAGGIFSSGTTAYKSTDGGLTWNFFHSGWPNCKAMDLLAAGTNVYAAVAGSLVDSGVYRSQGAISNWMPFGSGLPWAPFISLAARGNTIYAGTMYAGVFKSEDNGEHWSRANTGIGAQNVYSLAVSGSNLFAGAFNGVYMLRDGSNVWENITYNIPLWSITKLSVNDEYLFAATAGASVWQIPLKSVGLKRVEKAGASFEVYPNPANAELAVGGLQLAKGDRVRVMDISGRLIEDKIINEATGHIEISTVNFVDGIYFVQVIKDGNLFTRKFVVMH